MKTILVTGASGYIGRNLIPQLINKGYRVRCMVRDKQKITERLWYDAVEVVCADVFDTSSLAKAMQGIDAVYYLIHSMSDGKDFHKQDLLAAKNFAQAAKGGGVQQLIYLGGLGNSETDLSVHLRSRQETGEMLRQSTIPVTEFRAAVIVGSGSLSFEMIRYLTERVPVMICPSWVYTKTQPIAISDVTSYLVAALETEKCLGQTIEIGGADVISYKETMLAYAKARGLKRLMIPVPVLTPRLSSYWVHLVTPIPSSIAQPLIDGLKNEVIVRNHFAKKIFPQIKPISYYEAVQFALSQLQADQIYTRRDSNFSKMREQHPTVIVTRKEGMIMEEHQILVQAGAEALYKTFTSLGGQTGWLSMNWAWHVRGLFDKLIGGVGMRSGRRDPNLLCTGDSVDFWRVETLEPNRLLRLCAEMKVPGQAWLQFEILPYKSGHSILIQTAFFAPRGLFGILYWNLLYPIHRFIFKGLIRKIAQQSC